MALPDVPAGFEPIKPRQELAGGQLRAASAQSQQAVDLHRIRKTLELMRAEGDHLQAGRRELQLGPADQDRRRAARAPGADRRRSRLSWRHWLQERRPPPSSGMATSADIGGSR